MDNIQRIKRQLQLLDALMVAASELRNDGKTPHTPSQFSMEVAATLVLAARVEALEDMLSVALPTAGEGI